MNRTIKRLICAAVAAAMLPVSFLTASGEESAVFDDIKGHWAKADIEYLYNAGLVSGMSETEFAPDLTIDKAQFITMLVRSLGLSPDIYSATFSDVAPLDDWFAGYLGAAVNAEIIENSVYAFAPDSKISRGTAALMLNNAIEYEGLSEEIPDKSVSYSDVAEDGELSEAVQAVSALGVMVGTTEEEFEPEGTLTRAEAAAVVKRLSLAASAVGEISVPLNITDAVSSQVEDGVVTMSGDYSSFAIENVDFHYGINQLKVSAATSSADLQLEMWIDSLDTMLGTKLGTICLETSGASFSSQSTDINNTYGTHKVYFRLIGAGSASISEISIKANELSVVPKSYSSKSSGVSRSGSALYNFKRGAYANYSARSFGTGYNMIELTMSGSSDGQLFEIFIADRKAAVVETKKAESGTVTVTAPIVSADGSKTMSIKAATDIDGKLENIRFYNETGKADLTLTMDSAETELAVSEASDYTGGSETEIIRDGDVIKFSNVNMSNGYNVLSARIKNDEYLESSLGLSEDGEVTASVMSIFSEAEDGGVIEVRLDSEDGKLIGTIEENPIAGGEEYDTQSCYLKGAEGIHDVYLKAKGDTDWRLEYIKLQERGIYDLDMMTFEAENMTNYLGEIPAVDDTSRFEPHSVNSEASGKSSVKITQNGGYVEFTIPDGYEAGENRTAITVRHSIPDYIDSANHSVGQEGKMQVLVNGEEVGLLSSFENFKKKDTLTLSSKYVYGYGSQWGVGNQQYIYKDGYYSNFFFDDAYAIIEGEVKGGDVIRLIPEITDEVNFCYIDLVDIETIPELKTKPEGYLSITECGAVPNDGSDDGEALRKAVEMVNDDPYNYYGIWIPEGLFDITSYIGDRASLAADFSGIRVLGAGEWYSQLLAHLGTWTAWCGNYSIAENTVIRDVALHSETVARGWATDDGITLGAIGLNGSGATFVENVWFEHWNANIWVLDGFGVYANNRVKNTWADGFNAHNSSKDMQFYKNYMRATGDDALAVFSSCERSVELSEDIQIRNNTVIGVYWASGITIWGANDLDINNNLVTDVALHTGIGLNSWGYESPAPENLWIRNNRIERCGNVNEGNQDNGAFGLTPAKAKYTYGTYNNVYRNIFCENNEFIDNPSVFMRVSSQSGADEVYLNIRYNYVRNTCLAFPERRRVIDYRTSAVKGKDVFAYNVLEGKYEKFKTSNTSEMTDVLVGNVPNNWN